MGIYIVLTTLILPLLCVWTLYKIVGIISYRQKLRKYNALEVPKYPNRDPIFGLDYFTRLVTAFGKNNFLDFSYQNFATYGWTYQVNELGKTFIKSTDPAIAKAFYTTNFNDLGIRPLRWDSGLAFFGPSIVDDDGPFWQVRRAWLRPSFERVHVANFERLRRHSETFMSLLPEDGSTVDLAPLFARLNLDTSSEFIFGKSLDALTDAKGTEKFMDAFQYAVRGTAIKYMLGKWLMLLHRDKAFDEARDIVYKYVDARVDDALQRREKLLSTSKVHQNSVAAQDRLKLVDELATETQDRLDLRYQIIAVFNPAHKQTGVTLTNAFFLLARHPVVWARLRAEILPTAHQPLSYELLKQYKLVSFTVKETNRLLTTAAFNQRQALRDFTIPSGGGKDGKAPLFISKGTVVEIHARSMHVREDLWGKDAAEFKPERWHDARPGFAFVPFGGGPRACVGQELVNVEVAFMLVTMLRKFEKLERRDTEVKWVEAMNMAFESKNGAVVGLMTA